MPGRQTPARLSGNLLVGRTAEVTVERIVAGGYGLGQALGRTVFVTGAAPRERLLVRFDRTPGKIAFASVVEVLTASPDRVPPPHPALAGVGADFQHLSYAAQLAAKQAIIVDCLQRIGGLSDVAPPDVTPSPRQWGYRSRAEWHFAPATGALGYITTGSHTVVDLPDDPLVVPALAAAFGEIRQALAFTPEEAETHSIRAAAGDAGVSLAPAVLPGTAGPVRATVRGETYAYDANCFFQSNASILPAFVAEALWQMQFLPETPGERPIVELYSGVGLFTVPLARAGGRIVTVESETGAVGFAAENLAAVPGASVRLVETTVEDWLGTAYRTFGRPPLALANPPRTGLAGPVLAGLQRLRPERITYISCDPATLARDLKGLLAADYTLERFTAFDMFPQTHHVEVIAHLRRADTA